MLSPRTNSLCVVSERSLSLYETHAERNPASPALCLKPSAFLFRHCSRRERPRHPDIRTLAALVDDPFAALSLFCWHGECYSTAHAEGRNSPRRVHSSNFTDAPGFLNIVVPQPEPQLRNFLTSRLEEHGRRSSVNHYHIRWSGLKLDWEVFNTHEAAQKAAKQLVLPNETCTIE